MKIGIDCRLWDETGVGRYIRNLVLNLQKLDKENKYVLFVLSKDYSNIKSQLITHNSQLVKADVKWHSVEEQLKFPMILKRENLDLMHFTYISVPIFYNKPFVVTIHDLIPYHFPTSQASTLSMPLYNLKLFGYKFVINIAAKKAKKIIAVSNVTKEEIIDHLGVNPQKVVVTHEGVDCKITNPKSQASSKFQISNFKLKIKKYFLYVGNTYPHKNLERLLETFKLLNSDSGLVLVGKEDYFYKRLKRKAREMGISDRVIFLQNVSDQELVDLYRNALALVLPSLMEGFGLPALEAMENKCLVLASDIPSLIETCGNAALYFNPLNINDLADKLSMVSLHTTEYGELERLRREGVRRAKLFSWRKMAKETLVVYQKSAPNP